MHTIMNHNDQNNHNNQHKLAKLCNLRFNSIEIVYTDYFPVFGMAKLVQTCHKKTGDCQ